MIKSVMRSDKENDKYVNGRFTGIRKAQRKNCIGAHCDVPCNVISNRSGSVGEKSKIEIKSLFFPKPTEDLKVFIFIKDFSLTLSLQVEMTLFFNCQ